MLKIQTDHEMRLSTKLAEIFCQSRIFLSLLILHPLKKNNPIFLIIVSDNRIQLQLDVMDVNQIFMYTLKH